VIGAPAIPPGAAPRGSGAPRPADGETRGTYNMHEGGPFYSRALCGGNAGPCNEREREVTAQCGGRVSVLARAARHNSDVTVATTLRGGDAEDVCSYAVSEEVSWTRGRIDAATRHTRACQCMVPTRRGARELEARRAACSVSKKGGRRCAA
jgi:hypothetical protein